jgi:hypothetical protein
VWQYAGTTTNFFTATDNLSEICAVDFDTNGSGSNLYNFQPTGTNKFKLFYRNRIHGQTGTACLNSVPPATWVDDIVLLPNGNSFGIALTNLRHLSRPSVAGTPVLGDFGLNNNAGAGSHIIEPAFSGFGIRYYCTASAITVSTPCYETWEAIFRVINPATGLPRAGYSVEVTDQFGTSWVDTDTDADGIAQYGTGLLVNRLPMMRMYYAGVAGAPTKDALGPFRVRVNHKHTDGALAVLDFQWVPSGNATFDYRQNAMEIALTVPTLPLPTQDVPYFRETEIDVMLKGFGQDVSVGGVMVKGLLDRTSVERLEGWGTHVTGTEVVVVIHTGSLPATIGAALSTDGIDYLIRDMKQVEDGALTRLLLALA